MQIERFNFDEDLEMIINIPQQSEEIILAIRDDLDIHPDVITEEYTNKINEMLSKLDQLIMMATHQLREEFPETNKFRLLQIILLSKEFASDFIVGFMYRVEQDIEHGRGMKISLNDMKILEYGLADVAFS